MLNGVASPADQFLSAYSLLDLIGTQSMSGAVLEQTSVSNFFRSRSYSTEGSIAASARTLAEAFASPSYLSSARSYQSLIKYGYPDPPRPCGYSRRTPTTPSSSRGDDISKRVQRLLGAASIFSTGRGWKSFT